uniref:Uncharacterized protein n=1 Tax=Anguilla anguilla TaxID=7936 RepID=A0A0E9PS48_ANGAN
MRLATDTQASTCSEFPAIQNVTQILHLHAMESQSRHKRLPPIDSLIGCFQQLVLSHFPRKNSIIPSASLRYFKPES